MVEPAAGSRNLMLPGMPHPRTARSTATLPAAVALAAVLWSGGCAPATPAPPAPSGPAPAATAPTATTPTATTPTATTPTATTPTATTPTTAAPTTGAPAQAQPPVEAGAVRITGAVRQPGVRTAAQLAAIPSQTVAVAFGTEKGTQRHTEVGVPLSIVLEQAAPVLTAGRKHDELTIGVLVIGADGYRALVSYGEVAPALGNSGALLATSQDGTPLARPRLVLPKDGQGARYVSDVVELQVVHLGPGS